MNKEALKIDVKSAKTSADFQNSRNSEFPMGPLTKDAKLYLCISFL